VWARTVLLITYDENDGYFDHVVPPFAAAPGQGGSTVDTALEHFPGDATYAPGPYGLGQRVPMVVVSPWSTGGYVCSETFDHTSIIRFLERRFGVHEPQISPWRRAVCGDLTSAFDFSLTRDKPARLPDTDGYQPPDSDRHDSYVPVPPAEQRLPRQEKGRRPARPLPYAPATDAAVDARAGSVTLSFSGGPDAGACFVVTAGDRTDGPWTYTAAAGRSLTGVWDTAGTRGGYDLTVHGPNGYLRSFAGTVHGAGPEVTARHERGTGRVELTLVNDGASDVRFTVSEAYSGHRRTLVVRAGRRTGYPVETAAGGHWYDISVVSDRDKSFSRRFAGHVETGRPSVSDPAIATE